MATVGTVALTGITILPAAAHEVAVPPPAGLATPQQTGADAADAVDLPGPATARIHIVERGESLSKIAVQYGYSEFDGWRRLYDANTDVANPNVIEVGQKLQIPAATDDVAARDLPVVAPARRGERAASRSGRTSAPASGGAAVAGAGVWDQLAACESGGNWSINTGNGYRGGLQFHPQTWTGFGGGEFAATADQASRDQQIAVAQRVQAKQGWGAWPACSRKLGLR